MSQSDVAAAGAASMLEQHKVFLNAGHSEYWDAGRPGQRHRGP